MVTMKATKELDLGIKKIAKVGGGYYISIPKALVDSGAVPIDAEYHVTAIVKTEKIVLEEMGSDPEIKKAASED
jgi:hypothetical protein